MRGKRLRIRRLRSRTLVTMPCLGFASGLPLALTSGTLQAWLTTLLMDRYAGDYQWQTPKDRGPSHLHCAS